MSEDLSHSAEGENAVGSQENSQVNISIPVESEANSADDSCMIVDKNIVCENADKLEKGECIDVDAKKNVAGSDESKDRWKKNRSRSRSRSRHRRESPSRERRERKRSRSRNYRSRRSKSREGKRRSRSRSRDKRKKSKTPDRKRYRSRSADKKTSNSKAGVEKHRESKSPSPGKSSRQRPQDSESGKKRRRSRSRDKNRYEGRDHRYRKSPDSKQGGGDYNRGYDDSFERGYPRQQNKRYDESRFVDDKFSRDGGHKNDRRNEVRQFNNNNNNWNRDSNQANWGDKGRYPSSNLENTSGGDVIQASWVDKGRYQNKNAENATGGDVIQASWVDKGRYQNKNAENATGGDVIQASWVDKGRYQNKNAENATGGDSVQASWIDKGRYKNAENATGGDSVQASWLDKGRYQNNNAENVSGGNSNRASWIDKGRYQHNTVENVSGGESVQASWIDKGRYQQAGTENTSTGSFWKSEDRNKQDGNQLEDFVGKSIAKIRQDFETRSCHGFSKEVSSNQSAIPVLLSSNNCQPGEQHMPFKSNMQQVSEINNFTKPVMLLNSEGRLPAPPRMSTPPTNFKDGLPNVREPPPGFMAFRPDNPMQVRIQGEPTPPPPPHQFAILNHQRLPVKNMESQQVLLQPLQMIRGPAKMDIPVDLRFVNPELRLPLYSTGIVNRPLNQAPHVTNIIRGLPVDQPRMVPPGMVGLPQSTDVPPPPPPPQTYTLSQPPSLPPNSQFGTIPMPRLPENISFLSNQVQPLVFNQLGSRPSFITNLQPNEMLHARVSTNHPPPPPPHQIVHSSIHSQLIMSAPLNISGNIHSPITVPSNDSTNTVETVSESKCSKLKPKNVGSEKYSPYSCTSDGSSVDDEYTEALFDHPFNDSSTPLEEENNSFSLEQASPLKQLEEMASSTAGNVNTVNETRDVKETPVGGSEEVQSSSIVKSSSITSLVDLSGIAKSIDLSSTLNMFHVNDLKKVLETAASTSGNKSKSNETTNEGKSSKAQRMDQIAEEVKLALKPHFSKNLINKEEYKDIMRRAVPKIFGSKSTLDSSRIQSFVQEYVNKIVKSRKSGKVKNTTAHGASHHDKKQTSKISMKA